MRELGYIEGKNLVIEWRFADGQAGNLPGLAAELVRMRVDIIVTHSNGTFAAQRATSSIPIVFATASDPVLSGFAASLARPAGNITGLSDISLDLSPKRLDLLKTMIPTLTSAIVLLNPGNPAHASVLKSIQAAGQKLKIRITPLEAGTQDEIERGFAALKSQGNTAIFVASDGFLLGQGQRIADLAVKHRMPSMFHNGEGVIAGGLMSYGQNLTDFFHRAAAYAGKIIKGAKPGDLPIEQPMRFELAVNLKTVILSTFS